jgi:hypothetical protein
MSSVWGADERNSSVVEMHKTQRWGEELPNNKWPNINEEIALRKLRTGDKNTKQRNVKYPSLYDQMQMGKPDEENKLALK